MRFHGPFYDYYLDGWLYRLDFSWGGDKIHFAVTEYTRRFYGLRRLKTRRKLVKAMNARRFKTSKPALISRSWFSRNIKQTRLA